MRSELLRDKTIIVTGAAGLLGREFCHAIAAQRGRVIVADIDLSAAGSTADSINALFPGAAAPVCIDITSKSSVEAGFGSAVSTFGTVHSVVNNAYPRNANYGRKTEDVEFADFVDNVGMHLGGYFLICQQAAKLFASTGGGTIINISSIYGLMAPRFSVYNGTTMTMPVEYAAIKAGINHLTRYFAQYYKQGNVRVNAISPGGVTDAQPERFRDAYAAHCASKGLLSASDLSGTLVFLLSDLAQYINGQNIVVDDGFSL